MTILSSKFLKVILTIIVSYFFSSFLLSLFPSLKGQYTFLLGIPIFFMFLIASLINVQAVLIFILFVRASLDPLLSLTRTDILGEGIGIGGALNFLVIVIFVLLLLKYPRDIFKNKTIKSWAFFLLLCWISIFYSPWPGRGTRVFLQLVSYMSICIVPSFIIKTHNDRKLWINILLFSSVLHIILADVDLIKHGIHERIQGAFSHPNILAYYAVFMIAIIFFILKSNEFVLSKIKVNILRVYLLNLFILLVFTKTRNAWIACSVMFFVYGLLKDKKYILFSTVIPLLLCLNTLVIDRMKSAFSEGAGVDNSLSWRLQMWKVAWGYIKERFMFGYGLSSFNFISFQFPLLVRGSDTHNTYLEILFETGILGLLGYVSIFWISLKVFFARMKSSIGSLSIGYAIAIAYTISYMVICFADNMRHYLAFNWYVWFFMGIMLTSIKSQDQLSK